MDSLQAVIEAALQNWERRMVSYTDPNEVESRSDAVVNAMSAAGYTVSRSEN